MTAAPTISARVRLRLPLALAAPVWRAAAQAAARPNILMIAVDDLNTDLGCYGHAQVLSPNVDALARRGIRFDRAFCQYPVCNPSRTSLLSGRYPESTGILENTTNPRAHMPDAVFLPEFLRRNGYFTGRVGKIYHDGMDGPNDWDVSLNPRPEAGPGRQGEGRNLTGGKFAFFQWRAAEGGDEDQPDGMIAAEAVRLVEQKREKPWFLAVGLRKPHDPYIAPKKYFEPYPLDRIAGPPGPANDEDDIPAAAYPPVRHGLGPLEAREYKRAYFACITFMDAQVGKVMAALERSGQASRTLVVFFGDHGLHLGEHGWWNKVTLFGRSARVPMMVAGPPVSRPGRVCRRPVELLSLYPSFAEWTGLRPPAGLQGASLMPLVRDPDAAWSRAAYTVVTRGKGLGRCLHDERFRYTEWPGGEVELYDHDSDPHEYRNLRDDAAYARVRRELANRLRESTTAAKPAR